MKSLITAEKLTLGYENDIIVSKISFSINEGDYLCIVGENGTGKSTFVKTLLGLTKPVDGKIVFQNGFRQNEIGYLPQRTESQKDFPSSVSEIVLSGCLARHRFLLFYPDSEKKKAKETISRLGLEGLDNKAFNELSGGQQQRVLLSRALMATDRLLLLDEPTSGLDIRATSELYRILRELNGKGITILMVTHDIHPALNDANMILSFSKNSYFYGTKEEYFDKDEGRDFLKKAGHHEHN